MKLFELFLFRQDFKVITSRPEQLLDLLMIHYRHFIWVDIIPFCLSCSSLEKVRPTDLTTIKANGTTRVYFLRILAHNTNFRRFYLKIFWLVLRAHIIDLFEASSDLRRHVELVLIVCSSLRYLCHREHVV